MRIKTIFLSSMLFLSMILFSCSVKNTKSESSNLIDVSIGLNEIQEGYKKLLLQDSILMDILYRVDIKNISDFSAQSSISYSRVCMSGKDDEFKYHQVFTSYNNLSQEGNSPDVTEYIYDSKSYKTITNGESVILSDATHLSKEKLLQCSVGEWKVEDIKEIYKVISGNYCQYTVVLSDSHFDKHSHDGDSDNIPQKLLTRTYIVALNLETGIIEHTSQHDVSNVNMFGETEQYNRYTDCSYQFSLEDTD